MLDWGVTTISAIRSTDEENRVVTLENAVKDFDIFPWFVPTPFGSCHYRFYVENALEELDQPGEWCLDTEEGKLYFWPPVDSIEKAERVRSIAVLRTTSWAMTRIL